MTEGQQNRVILTLRELIAYIESRNDYLYEPDFVSSGKELLRELEYQDMSEMKAESIQSRR